LINKIQNTHKFTPYKVKRHFTKHMNKKKKLTHIISKKNKLFYKYIKHRKSSEFISYKQL